MGYKKQLLKNEPYRRNENNVSELKRLTIEAREHGMSYGQYVAMKGI
jgi:hypothetical protein